MMYESPIKMIVDDMAEKIVREQEDYIVKCVQNIGVSVDKAELVRELAYDRQQYDKGFADGYAKAKEDVVRCKDCKHHPKLEWFSCPMSHLNEKQRPETAWCWKGKGKTMSDLISKQAAIEVANAVWSVTGDKNVVKVWDQIKDLPSAHCDNCPYPSKYVTQEDAVSRKAAIDAVKQLQPAPQSSRQTRREYERVYRQA